MTAYLLRREQFIPRPIEAVFAFFAQAENLDHLTPAWLRFQILTSLPILMQKGTLIHYRIRWGWVPMTWSTEITTWNPPFEFVDEQRRGPYKFWQHTHSFRPSGEGMLMTDTVRYVLPWGPLGKLAHWLLVKRDLQTLFDYRRQRIEELFVNESNQETAVAKA